MILNKNMSELKQLHDSKCRGICAYYDVNSKFRQERSNIFRKTCFTCNKTLIAKFSRCPCCHSEIKGGLL